ncbi:MAG: hypothetical protein RIS76_1176 [Verrucomicrobiota bacterium]
MFDLSTGTIVSVEHPMRRRLPVVIALLVVGLFGFGAWRIWGPGRPGFAEELRSDFRG